MAAAEPLQTIKEELTCPICLNLFRDTVTSECGHSFCRECITRLCQGDRDIACPLCKGKLRKGNLRPNRELRNIVESLRAQAVEDPRGGYMCKMHQKPLRFYCKEDETPVCLACERSQTHHTHTVVPVEEAVQDHRESIEQHLQGIESGYETLNKFVSMGWMHLPQSAREEEHQRLKRLTDKVATLLKVHTEGPRQRSDGAESQTQPRDPVVRDSSPRKDADETESQEHKGREPGSEPAAGKQEETRTHVGHVSEGASTSKEGLDQATLDPLIHRISSTTGAAQSKESIRQQLEGIESSYEKLNQLLTTGWMHLLQKARAEEHQRLQRLIDNVATLFKVAEKKTMKRPLTPAEGSGGSRTDASPANREQEGAAMGSGTEAAGEGQEHPAKKKKDNEN